jgi:exopolysaccharide biosynthesis protein
VLLFHYEGAVFFCQNDQLRQGWVDKIFKIDCFVITLYICVSIKASSGVESMSSNSPIVRVRQKQISGWSWLKKTFLVLSGIVFLISCFLFLTPPGTNIRNYIAATVIMTQHRDWAWLVVGAAKRDAMIKAKEIDVDNRGATPVDQNMITVNKRARSTESLIKVEDISGPRWKGKKIYVYDPTSIRVVVPSKSGEGERISSMVSRTGAVAGVNGGGFDDPDGLGNGFAPIGLIMSGGDILYTGYTSSVPQQVVAFTDKGIMIIGKYSIDELIKKHVTEAVTFAPRIIANGVPLIKSGDGGSGIQPRTAVAQRADGTVIFVIIDGRQASSVGATEKEVQDLFMQEGAINAGFLDGGASSELVTQQDGLLTKPSSRYGERRLPSAFLVFDDPKSYQATKVWDGLTHIDPGGAYDNPDFLAEQARKRKEGKLNTPVPTKTPSHSNTPSQTAEPNTSTGGGESPNPVIVPTESQQPGVSDSPTPTPAPTPIASPKSPDPTPNPMITPKTN